MLSFANKLFVKPVKYERFAGYQRNLEREKMYELQSNSSKEIWIVAGEFDEQFYNKQFADIISEKLKKIPGFKVNILFSKDETLDYEERIKLIYEKNRHVCKLLENGAFGGRLSMFLSEKRPDNHFGIVDDSILIEKIHKSKELRDVLLVHNYQTLVEKYKRYFNELIKNPGIDNKITKLTSNNFKDIAA